MLKKNYIVSTSHTLSMLISIWKFMYLTKHYLNLVTPNMFWIYTKSNLFILLQARKFFFFKFFNIKKFRRTRFVKFSNLSRRENSLRSKLPRSKKKVKIVRWFTETQLPIRKFKKKWKWLFFIKRFVRWQRSSIKRFRKYRVYKNFMKCLGQRIELAQNCTGKFLFNTNNKKTLKRLFNLFRKSTNTKLFYSFFYKHFYFATFYKKFLKKYAKVFCTVDILKQEQLHLTYCNLNNLFFFKKRKLLRLYPFNRKRYIYRFFHKGFSKKKRFLRRRMYRKQKRTFINYYKSFKRFYVKVNILHKEPLSSVVFNNMSNFYFYTYYLNYLINIWNIRSYNWKQIT